MDVIKHITDKFKDTESLHQTFLSTPPCPMIVLDDFLPTNVAEDMQQECETIPEQRWTTFTRRDSHMKECVDLNAAPVATNVVNQLHSQAVMRWLSKLTGIAELMPDPYLTGAGYSKSYRGDSLKIHTDFNWNETIKMHRMLSFIIYLNKDWKDEYEGHLHFYDFQNEKLVQKISPVFNRAVIWLHHKKGFHGHPHPLTCPESMSRNAFRLFFYVSNAQHDPNDSPHRSLYWFDPETQEPYDDRSCK
jgi:Rps23 Pro-64 3,4-dihydroxylase Tpa1-like proline 4-hydroxylase